MKLLMICYDPVIEDELRADLRQYAISGRLKMQEEKSMALIDKETLLHMVYAYMRGDGSCGEMTKPDIKITCLNCMSGYGIKLDRAGNVTRIPKHCPFCGQDVIK